MQVLCQGVLAIMLITDMETKLLPDLKIIEQATVDMRGRLTSLTSAVWMDSSDLEFSVNGFLSCLCSHFISEWPLPFPGKCICRAMVSSVSIYSITWSYAGNLCVDFGAMLLCPCPDLKFDVF